VLYINKILERLLKNREDLPEKVAFAPGRGKPLLNFACVIELVKWYR
jgi:hypothetical protein